MKIKVIFDSTVGYSKNEIEAKGAGFVPITVTYNGEERLAGVDIDANYLEANLSKEDTIQTAAVSLGLIEEAYRSALSDADHVVYLSLSAGLSASNKNAKMVADEDEFSGKVTVIDSNFVAPVLKKYADSIIAKAKEGSLDELLRLIEKYNKDIVVFLTPGNLTFLHKGGRISKVQYIAGSLLKVQPVLTFADGGLTSRDVIKGKKLSGGIAKIKEALAAELEKENFKGQDLQFGIIAYGQEKEMFKSEAKALIEKIIPGAETYDSVLDAAIMAHTGPNVYAIAIAKK